MGQLWHKGAFQASETSALTRLTGGHSGSLAEMPLLPSPQGAHPRLTSPRCPTAMRAQVGWKAPVPHASRWVRLWGCSTRTKLAHSI